ncbi:MAG: 2-phospho-L-lactate transferase CofD family protein [Candidatus Omnitrophica bacterium]|nr:2-phospho-L-lactate transferase CofD family protein [Candidatus Omnitrophota bacterium]
MLAPILLSRLVGISQERIKVILSEVDGVDKDQLEALIKEIIARERRVERGWESFGVQRWLDKTLMIASERGYAQNEAIMLDAYRGAMEAALISADQPQARAKEIAAAITGNAEFKSAFHILYARLSGGTAVSEPPKDGEKSYPAGASGNEFSEALQKTDNYGRLLDVYGGNERELQRDLLEEAARNKASVVDIVIGRFGDDAKKLRQKLSGVSQTAQGPPDFSSDVLLLSGGSASRLWAPILLGLNPGLSINALVTNVDDGGATQHIINALRENGYGITPPLGDQVNSLFNSFLKADKIFTMLDDSGRIKIGYMGLSEEELLGMSLRDVMAIALRQAKIRDNLFGQALAAMDAGDFEKAGECLEKIKVTLAGIGLAKTSQAVNLDMRYDGAEALLAAALEQRKPRNLESIRRSHERNLSADFLTFSANLLNLADIVDKGIPGFDGKPIFNMKTLLKQNQSIRNLLLLAVLYDEGVFVRDLRLPEGRNAVDTKDKMRRYQMAVNRLAKAVGITNGQVSMSSFKPSVVYARYQDNVLAWWENISLDEKIQRNTRFHTENNGNSLVVTIDQRHGPSMVIRNPDGTDEASRISGTPLIKTLSRGQDILIKTLDSHGNILNAIEVGLDKEGKAYFSLNGDHWVVDESESGDVTYLVKDDKKIRLKNDNPGCGYKDKVLGFNGEGLGALFVPRFIAMQTHVTETVNLSKIVEYGFAEVKEENIVVSAEGGNEVREEHRVFSAPSAEAKSISRDDTNQVAVEMINNVSSGGYILTGPGSFFTSLCSHLLCDGVVEAIKAARARGVRSIFVFNPNEDNETVGLSLSELINFIEKISGAKFAELFDTALISDQVDYIKLLDYDKEYDDLTRKGDYKSDIASRVGIALRNKPDGIEKLGLSVFKLLIDEYIEERSIAVPYGVERYEWAIRNDPELLSRVTAQSAQFATLLFDRIYLTTRAAGDPANMAKKSTAPLTVDDAAVKYLSDSGVDVRRASIYGLVVSINRGDGKAKSSLGYLPELLKVMPLTSEIASMTFEQDISRLASVLKMDKARVRDAVRSKIDTNTLLTNFAESVGIKRTAALKNMAQAGLAEVTGDETYILTDALFSRVLLEKFISIQIKGLRLTDLTPLRLERIILDSVDVSGLIEQLSLTYGKSSLSLTAARPTLSS